MERITPSIIEGLIRMTVPVIIAIVISVIAVAVSSRIIEKRGTK